MQRAMDKNSDKFSNQDIDCDKNYSEDVIEYVRQVLDIISWLYAKQEELNQRPSESSLQNAAFTQVLEEYSWQERFISQFCEYCNTIMKCKLDGQDMLSNDDMLADLDRDEIQIQLDNLTVHHEKHKILVHDRLCLLQKILKDRQQTKIERFEEWLSAMELKIASMNNIGPDYETIQKQMKDMNDIGVELEQKQDFLNFMSSIIIFDEVDRESLQIYNRSCESLYERQENMNCRWTEICRFVDDRNAKLKKAESIWKLLALEGHQLLQWLEKVERSLSEVSEAARNIVDVQSEKAFLQKLLYRSDKIDHEIKSKQSFYTCLENRVRDDIEKFDDPCSMLVIELEKKLEDMQDSWNTMMNRKRMLDYTLQALSNPEPVEQAKCMIPLPDPITPTSNTDLRFTASSAMNEYLTHQNSGDHRNKESHNEHLSLSSSSGHEDKESSLHLNGKTFDNSLSSRTRSLLYGNNNQLEHALYDTVMDSQDELSSTSMTTSYPTNNISATDYNLHSSEPSTTIKNNNHYGDEIDSKFSTDDRRDGAHSCRVEEWKHSLESFSNWLKQVETSLGIDSTLDTLEKNNTSYKDQSWSRLDLHRQLVLLNEIENQIISSCQDEFDCLILQGQQIIEDLIPEIGDETEYETNLNKILTDIDTRYAAVKRCINGRKMHIADQDRWNRLLKSLKESCDYLIDQMGRVLPETDIGVDLITLAQQQDLLKHSRIELDENITIQSNIEESKLFFKICDTLQQNQRQSHTSLSLDNIQRQKFTDSALNSCNNDIWLSFKDLRENIESQLDRLTLHFSELSQLIEDRLARLDEVHKEMHCLQHKMQELATSLQVAEILKSNWVPLENLSVEKLSEQLEDLKIFRERISETESIHKVMNSIFEWMTKSDVPLSNQNLKRISELNTIWSLIQVSVEERQKLIEQAFDNQGASAQKFLEQTVADLPSWGRRVATSKVPYFIDHDSNTTKWDHPKFTELLKKMSETKQVVFSAYRTALKLRIIQKGFGIDLMMLEQLKEVIDSSNLSDPANNSSHNNETKSRPFAALGNHDTLIGVEQIISILKAVYERIQSEEKLTLDVPLSIDLTLNWLLNLYDTTRSGFISVLSLKVGLALICCATREEKYIYMYEVVTDQRAGNVDARKLGTLFETCMRIPIYLGEGESFGGAEIIETSIRNCFSMSKFNPSQPNSIDLTDYLNWLKTEPQFIIWLPVLHRILITENMSHDIKCQLCKTKPIVGLRYRCLKCFKFNICQNCFLLGRHIYEHLNPIDHPMQEYNCTTSTGQKVRDFTKIIRNKLKPNHQ